MNAACRLGEATRTQQKNTDGFASFNPSYMTDRILNVRRGTVRRAPTVYLSGNQRPNQIFHLQFIVG